MELIDILEVFRDHLVEFSILIFEFIGVGIIIVSGIHGFYLYLKKFLPFYLCRQISPPQLPCRQPLLQLPQELHPEE